MTLLITGALFKQMLINAAVALENNRQEINELNVFPVPDGDTGTNMSLTLNAGVKALSAVDPITVSQAAEITESALLRGARGNSGVILSLLFRGLARSLKDVVSADAPTFASALASGVDLAYKAVMKPAEGTILTVSRLAAAGAVSISEISQDVEVILDQALKAGFLALAETVNQNPVLKKAGVVDAGAKGYLYILDGMLKALHGVIITPASSDIVPAPKADFNSFDHDDINFTYCTEFIALLEHKSNVDPLKSFLSSKGDSIVVVDDEEIVKVHVHTNEPGAVITEALTYGSLVTIKIENMREQHTEAITSADPVPLPVPAAPAKRFGVVAVCAGSGLEAVFRDLGADNIITGGQTMNPSTDDILHMINATDSETVFVLPNNKNIIMAAEQCISLSQKDIIVIPTKSIPQGIAAMLAGDFTNQPDAIAKAMSDAAAHVRTVQITLAARDSVFDDHDIKEGEYLALLDGVLLTSGADKFIVFSKVADELANNTTEFITVFTGSDAIPADTDLFINTLRDRSPSTEVSAIPGGQPVYHYIVSAE